MLLHFVHTIDFDVSLIEAGLGDADVKTFQELLCENPVSGVVIPGTHGIRKMRIAARGRGKRGGFRIIYFAAMRRQTVYLLLAYSKATADDLSAAGKKHLAKLASILEVEIS